MSTLQNTYNPDYAIHPGEILEEILESRGIRNTEFAERTGLSEKTISLLINGKAPLSTETALQFERVLGVSADIWTALDSKFRLHQLRLQKEVELEAAAEWVKQFPRAELRNRGIISDSRNISLTAEELLRFFGVSSIQTWDTMYGSLEVAFRQSKKFVPSKPSVMSWLRLAELEAAGVETQKYDQKAFQRILKEIRSLTRELPEVFSERMKLLCAEAGVALVLVPELPKTYLCGAVRWIEQSKAMLALTLRYKTDDQFWFSFFHEAGHIIQHEKRRSFIDVQGGAEDRLEKEADDFAREFLVPSKDYGVFVRHKRFFPSDIVAFADKFGIAPGIVVGMLQHDGELQYDWHNDLKRRFDLK